MPEQVYTVSVAPFFGVEAPGQKERLAGDVGISFSCDPDAAHRLIDMALAEVARLQVRACAAWPRSAHALLTQHCVTPEWMGRVLCCAVWDDCMHASRAGRFMLERQQRPRCIQMRARV